MIRISRTLALCTTAIGMISVAGQAYAGGFALREQSAYYQGMSFAGNATTGPSISSMFWNPAAITGAGLGITTESHHALIAPKAEINLDSTSTLRAYGNGGDIASDAWIGSSYTAYNVNDQVFFGLAVNAPFGLSTKPDGGVPWAGQIYNASSKVFSINANPMVGYKVNDQLAFGAGVQVQYFSVRLRSAMDASRRPALLTLEGDNIGLGVTAGVIYKPFAGTELGLGYRSGVAHRLDGTLTMASAVPINASLVTPDTVTFSAKQRVTDAFRVLGTVEWSNWSRLKAPKVTAQANGATITTLKFNYNDGWYAALGGEYDINQNLTVRAGAAYEWSPIDDKIRTARLPDNDRIWLSAGASYKVLENLSFDLGYTHIIGRDTKLAMVPGHQDYAGVVLSGKVDASVNIVSAAMRYRF
ncbi:47 kDa outer membrane protein precursor [Pannonibacter phragmitetus]|uniref:47 kDa outer membrane protein n=1 Tax=Pannonibacter phragmitetus TaxID=121719 RepID=A0A378ZY35_9HYPH|nr:OmpP1/FadL family transporter [Pannonibacter phragmitetus]SUB01759.1 47 kDa outer membrane protein precursor [Pannonibacter phragmitetus]